MGEEESLRGVKRAEKVSQKARDHKHGERACEEDVFMKAAKNPRQHDGFGENELV